MKEITAALSTMQNLVATTSHPPRTNTVQHGRLLEPHVQPLVLVSGAAVGERLPADAARERLFAGMTAPVDHQTGLAPERFAAQLAHERSLVGVDAQMSREIPALVESASAKIAREGTFASPHARHLVFRCFRLLLLVRWLLRRLRRCCDVG